MITAPKRSAGDQNERGPRRRQPTKALKKSTGDGGLHSVPALNNQPCATTGIWQTKEAFGAGNILYKTTKKEDHADFARLKAAGARAGHTLSQMRQVLRHWGLKHPPIKLQKAWLRIGVAQYIAIRASRPRWTLGLHNWVRRYLPEIWRTWPAERIDALARKMRREGTCFRPEEKGAMLGIDRDTYLALGLSDIWPAGMTREDRERDQRDAKNARERANNLASGKVKDPHVLSKAQTKPWVKLGISKRTFYRRQQQVKLPQAA